jgi:arylsulfatase A-like enzyme/Tfp pilus assembly protein PilF
VAAAAVLVALAAASGAAWWLMRPATPQRAALPDLGPLVAGAAQNRLNLVVITLDTARADHLGAYRSTTVKTPALDTLASDGVLFEQAMTTAPLTLPAHASIFTGRFPPEHGARDNGGFFLMPEQVTLAEVLKDRGFTTGGFIAAYVLDRKWGINQGFDTYFDDFDSRRESSQALAEIQRPGNEVLDKALPWITSVKDGRFFAWIHLYDPHAPYTPPEPFKSQYAGHPYQGEMAFTDSLVGRVIEHLKTNGLLEKTVIAVLGDHGESLGDHGENAHGFFIYQSAARVPFIIRAPFERTRARRVADPVRVVDLMPTVLELLGVPGPAGLSGGSLVPLMTGDRTRMDLEGYAESMYPLHHYGWSELRALRSGRYKAIDAPRPELYDLEQDPGETRNLFAERRALGDQMIARLRQMDQAFNKVAPAQPAVDVDPEVRSRLAALGYVGSFVASAADARTDRADPKDKIGLFNMLSTARETAAEKDGFARGLALYNKVVAEDPNVIDAWFSMGNLFFREHRYQDAVDRYKKALALKADYDLAVMNMASAYRKLGDDDAALAGFERYLTIDPRDPYVRYEMGEIYLDRKNVARAEAEFRKALEIDGRVARAKNALGFIAFQRGDVAAAETLIREALAIKADVRLAHYNLALVAEQRGDLRLAEKEYLLELEQHPDAYKAAFNLSRLYAQIGERDLEVDALMQAVDGNREFAPGLAYLAKAYLERGAPPGEVEGAARKAIAAAPRSQAAALAHYVLADLYNRTGRRADAAREAAAGRAIEGKD